MTTTLIHDPLLFYPYSKTYYEAANVYEQEQRNGSISSSSDSVSSSPSMSSSLSSTSLPNTLASRLHADADWNQIMTNVKKAMYNSTSAEVPSPVTYLCQNAPFMPTAADDPAFFYNTGIPDVKDMYSYRQLRSENLLCRMFKCIGWPVANVGQTSVMRLTKGVFVANQLQRNPHPYSSPVMGAHDFMDMSSQELDTSLDSIDTFHYGNMKQLMLQQGQQQQQQQQQNFAPFSYTFGARYTNPYQGRDIVIRGNQLPLWCQTLFLNECVSRMPLKPNVPYTGLFPFAPSFTVVFQPLSTQCTATNQDCFPSLTFDYERYAMEFSDPSDLMEFDCGWTEQKQQVMDQMLLCDITEESAIVLSQLAQIWAADQCLPF